jgi:hypothetical protein
MKKDLDKELSTDQLDEIIDLVLEEYKETLRLLSND